MQSNFQMESEKDQLRDGSTILKGILKEYDVTKTGFSGIGGGNTYLGRINSGRDLDQQSNGHWFYKNLISGIIHSLDYHHHSVFKIKLKLHILGILFHACIYNVRRATVMSDV